VSQWFRFYAEALDDPKVQKLDPVTFKQWVNILCLACKNEGVLPPHDDMAFALRIDIIALESLLDRLLIAGLIDVVKGGANGSRIAPHGWAKRQYKSDGSTERVKRYRQRFRNDAVTPPETETEAETEEPPVSPPAGDNVTVQDVVEGWNELAQQCDLPVIRKLTDARRRRLYVRLREYPDAESWRLAFRHIHDTPFLRGENRDGWRADFDFLLQAKSFTKLTEGSYGKAD
jgi:hypothetical protein